MSSFDEAVALHDQTLSKLGLTIWVGAEPTFTNRHSQASEWLTAALGAEKETLGAALAAYLRRLQPNALLLRTVGRQYPAEGQPRWSLGLFQRRDGGTCWNGPQDPLFADRSTPSCSNAQVQQFRNALLHELTILGWPAAPFVVNGALPERIVFRLDGAIPSADPAQDTRLCRPPVASCKIPLEGLRDTLAEQGLHLLAMGCHSLTRIEHSTPVIELPVLPTVVVFLTFLEALSRAANQTGLATLAITGAPPPIDQSVAWTTVTPDPAVLEINMAPAPDLRTFLMDVRRIYKAATQNRLSAVRFHYNGDITDSGGGGQITLGGPTPSTSPFFAFPRLAPRLVCYFNHHPSLSYCFASEFTGASSQSPRPDERGPDTLHELRLALELLARTTDPAPETIWRTLAPFLTDPSGNTHRSELNIEKLWNPYLPARGRLGLVEFRALRMAPDAESLTALAALFRSIVAMLTTTDYPTALIDWGNVLHDRFALPFYLYRDLQEILEELALHGVELAPELSNPLFEHEHRRIGEVQFHGCHLQIRRALEFWPLMGDAATQNHGTSRVVDSSTMRIEITLRPNPSGPLVPEGWQVTISDILVPFVEEQDEHGPVWVLGVRFRRFVPWLGLHPTLGAQVPLVLALRHRNLSDALKISLYDWKVEGGPYDGLPRDLAMAQTRRGARFMVQRISKSALPAPRLPPDEAMSPCCLDLRWL